jgi:hypothetical protein
LNSHGAEGEESIANLDLVWLARLEKRKRAELILFFTGGQTREGTASGPTDKRTANSIKKKRKNRTAVVLDETSSSSSESESVGER